MTHATRCDICCGAQCAVLYVHHSLDPTGLLVYACLYNMPDTLEPLGNQTEHKSGLAYDIPESGMGERTFGAILGQSAVEPRQGRVWIICNLKPCYLAITCSDNNDLSMCSRRRH